MQLFEMHHGFWRVTIFPTATAGCVHLFAKQEVVSEERTSLGETHSVTIISEEKTKKKP